MTLDELTHKVENDGATSEGRLTAEEYNTLLDAVKENRDNTTTAHIEGVVQGYTVSKVTVGVANPVSSGGVAEALEKVVQITPQTFSETQKQTARDNIDAITLYDLPDELLSSLWYGVEWDVTVSATAKTRIGNSELHRSLPIQNMMRGCLLNDNGDVVEYLPETSWVGATLDGSRGQVMVELPEHYRSFEEEGTIRRCLLSLYPSPCSVDLKIISLPFAKVIDNKDALALRMSVVCRKAFTIVLNTFRACPSVGSITAETQPAYRSAYSQSIITQKKVLPLCRTLLITATSPPL